MMLQTAEASTKVSPYICKYILGSSSQDIINGAFKGFAMLRQTAFMLNDPLAPSFDPPLYVPRYGFVASNQVGSTDVQGPHHRPTQLFITYPTHATIDSLLRRVKSQTHACVSAQ